MGIMRADGRVATRNYVGVLTSVNCSATVARAIADHFSRQTNPAALADYPERRRRRRADARHRLRHGHARAWACRSWSARWPATPRTPTSPACWWSAWAARPTRSTPGWRTGSLSEGETLPRFNIQDTGGTRKTVDKGIALIKEMLPRANAVKREPCSAAHITIGLQCGGSDGYSGISANPALGAAVDLLVAHGGTAILSRDARDLRRRAPADAPRREARSRREAGRAHQVVGALHRDQRGRDEQQPLARQQGRRPHDHPREIAGRGGQGRHHQPARRSTSTPSR